MSLLPSPPHVGLDQRLLARLKSSGFPTEAPVCLGFSGGADSLALAIALSRIKTFWKLPPVLVHINHQIRPRSDHDAVRCKHLADEIGLPLVVECLLPGIAFRGAGLGIEEQARRERYLALSRQCRVLGADVLITAHHLDDQVETVLMHLFRGSGMKGAAGMRELSTMSVPWWRSIFDQDDAVHHLRLWRPLLSERKKTLAAYVAASALRPVVDESNLQIDFHRNIVRHEILPAIENYWPGSIDAIGRFASAAARDDEYLTGQASIAEQDALTADGALRFDALNHTHLAISSRLVISWLVNAGVQEPTMDRIEAVLNLAHGGTGSAIVEVGSNYCVARFGTLLRVGTRTALLDHALKSIPGPSQPPGTPSGSIQVQIKGTVTTAEGAGWVMTYSISDSPDGGRTSDYEAASHPLTGQLDLSHIDVRRVGSGDRWLSSGNPVRDSLRQAGVHPLARNAVVCLAVGNGVLFVPAIPQPGARNDAELEPAAWLNLQWKTQ